MSNKLDKQTELLQAIFDMLESINEHLYFLTNKMRG